MSYTPPDTNHLDIRTLYASQKRRDDSKRELYETVVAKVHHRIRTVAARTDTICTFQIPPYIVGMPLYDACQCCGYVIRRLKREGFVVQYAHPNVLMIDWDRSAIEPHVREMEQRERQAFERRRIEQHRVPPSSAAAVPAVGGGGGRSLAAVQPQQQRPQQQHAATVAPPASSPQTLYVPTGKLFS